jgi:hypothetical protein
LLLSPRNTPIKKDRKMPLKSGLSRNTPIKKPLKLPEILGPFSKGTKIEFRFEFHRMDNIDHYCL